MVACDIPYSGLFSGVQERENKFVVLNFVTKSRRSGYETHRRQMM